jgi:hypothetical protein
VRYTVARETVKTSARSATVNSPVPAIRQFALLPGGQFRLFTAQLALRAGDGHALAGAHPQQVDLDYLDNAAGTSDVLGCSVLRATRELSQQAYGRPPEPAASY